MRQADKWVFYYKEKSTEKPVIVGEGEFKKPERSKIYLELRKKLSTVHSIGYTLKKHIEKDKDYLFYL